MRDPRGEAQPHRVYHIKGSAGPEPCRLCSRDGPHPSDRVHFASIGHPLAGDDLYGGHRDRIARQALHCARQSFRVPAYTEVPGGIRLETPVEEHARTIAVESPLPEDMRALLDAEI